MINEIRMYLVNNQRLVSRRLQAALRLRQQNAIGHQLDAVLDAKEIMMITS